MIMNSLAPSPEADRAPRPWRKLGLRVTPPGTLLMRSHAMLPTPRMRGPEIQVFFSACDAELRGRIFVAKLRASAPYDLIGLDEKPVLDVGAAGAFDADGVNPSCVVERGDELLLYYIGWARGPVERPYTLIAGIARSLDGGRSFEKLGQMLPLSESESLFRTAPYVFRTAGGWASLYIGGSRFIEGAGGKRLPIYSLRYVESEDGYHWKPRGRELLAPDPERGELGFGRPLLRGEGPDARLVVSVRTIASYRLCTAPWNDGNPRRADLVPLIETGPEAWDRDSTSFGAFCQADENELLFYNGNEFGRTGFGLAVRPLRT
jgi:hypothetical protein